MGCPPVPVLRRYLDHAESVDGDAEHRVDAGHADHEVDAEPKIAQHLAERPVLTHEQVARVERHRDGADEQVGAGQRRDEVVGGLADRPLEDERHQHHYVANDRCYASQGGEHGEKNYLPGLVAVQRR